MLDIKTLLIVIPALPLAAAVMTAALGGRVLRRQSHWPTVVALLLGFLAAVVLVFQMQQEIGNRTAQGNGGLYEQVVTLWRWADLGSPGASIDVALKADPLAAVMLAVVTCIASLVAVYSIGYMRDDPGYWRFFSYISLFVFAMTMLVLAANFVLLFAFWELVGLCSYLLIGFWYERPTAADAGKKAFLVNRIGDAGFLLGVFLIWATYGSLDFTAVFAAVGQTPGGWVTTLICLLLVFGACGKSAQFPLHVWLPDAMEGPTPVSALIHAATMVTAGVYMVARCSPLFAASPDAQCVVALIGGGTALLGAVIAVTQTDLKRILAYSTISHLGYMFLALGVGTLAGVTAGMFHLVTHAFFKALLFLGAGSIMHAAGGVIDIRRLGGLRHRLPITHWTYLAGCLAITGVVPLAGFWSKDAILAAVQQRAEHGAASETFQILFAVTLLGVLLIDFYTFRPYFLVFFGPQRIPPEAEGHAHESPGTMTGPLIVLAFGSIVVGAYFEWTHGLTEFLASTPGLACLPLAAGRIATQGEPPSIGLLSTGITALGIASAAVLYLGSPRIVAVLTRLMEVFGLYSLSYRKFFFDPLYSLLVVRPLSGLARLAAWCDASLVDGLVDALGRAPKLVGAALRPSQNGLVQFYALAMMLGVLLLMGVTLMR